MGNLRVGALARQAGVSPRTVRYYEFLGLLPPAPRSPNGDRCFRSEDLDRLRFIQRAKALGLTLAEIKHLLAVAEEGRCLLTQAELRAILEQKIAACTARIQALTAFRAVLEAVIQRLATASDAQPGSSQSCDCCAVFSPDCPCIPEAPARAA